MTDEELTAVLAKYLSRKGGIQAAAALLLEAQGICDSIAHGIRDPGGIIQDPRARRDYHLEITATVQDVRELEALIDKLDGLCRLAIEATS